MSRTTRRIIFYILIFIFLLLGVGVTLYAEGLRINIKDFVFTNVGGMYIVPSPRTAKMVLDGKVIKPNSGIFQKGTLVNGLFPRNHTLEISADGYKPWKRTIAVEPTKVSEIQYAVLVPEAPITQLGSEVSQFWLVNGAPLFREGTSTNFVLRGSVFSMNNVPEGWSPNEFLIKSPASGNYSVIDLRTATTTSLRPLIAKIGTNIASSSVKVTLDPTRDDTVFIQTPRSLSIGDVRTGTITSLASTASGTILSTFAVSQNRVAWSLSEVTSSVGSHIAIYDRLSRQTQRLEGALPGSTKALYWGDGNLLAAVQENGELYIYNFDTNRFMKRATDVRDVFFTGDGKKVAIIGRNSVEIFGFDTSDYARFNFQDINALTAIAWHNNNHAIFLQYPDRVMMLDIDDGHEENITQVATTTQSAYDAESNKFYYLDTNGAVSVLQFPKS